MTDLYAFELTPEYNLEELNGATKVFGPQYQTLDIKQALETGDGTIVADHPDVIDALRTTPVLQEVPAPQGAEPTELDVDLSTAAGVVPPSYIPQVPLVETEPAPQAVHAPEPKTVAEATLQPESQTPTETPSKGSSPPNNQSTSSRRGD